MWRSVPGGREDGGADTRKDHEEAGSWVLPAQGAGGTRPGQLWVWAVGSGLGRARDDEVRVLKKPV